MDRFLEYFHKETVIGDRMKGGYGERKCLEMGNLGLFSIVIDEVG